MGKKPLALENSNGAESLLLFFVRSYNLLTPEVVLTNPNLELERFQKSDDHIGE